MLKITEHHIFFYKEWPSNFHKTHFIWPVNEIDSYEFTSTEQAFMFAKAKRFGDDEIAKLILSAESPNEAKSLGRMVRNYIDSEWDKIRYDVMLSVNIAKYTQDKDLNQKILDDKFSNKEFVEASPVDLIWGVGLSQDDPLIVDPANWKGKNLLGKILTTVRKVLKNEI